MNNRLKTKTQLILENKELRNRITEMDATIQQGQDAHELAGEAHEYAQNIIETVRESLLVLDANLKIISANLSFYKTFNETPAGTLGSFIYELGNRQWDIPGLRTLLHEILPQNRRFDNYEVDHYFRDIGRKVMQLNACRIHHEHKGTQTILLAIEDITERKQLEEKLAAMAITDELTGLYNRRGLFVIADKLLKLSKRQGKGIFILYIDLDHLKLINDSMGHEEGDRVLIACADLLREIYRESDIVSRIGGDEFVVLPVGSRGDNTDVIISRLHKRLDVFNSCKDHGYILSLSAGVAYYDPQSNSSISDLLANGDKAMYEQKKAKYKD
jgi:diguanylate cyclase (GGDEF)-like protein/PAS domain S-box-containing protein